MKPVTLITATIMPMLGFVSAIVNPDCAPKAGIHLKGNPTCTCSGNTVTCYGFQVCGVGNNNAEVLLDAPYTATVDCTNPAGRLVLAQSKPVERQQTEDLSPDENGCLKVEALTITPPTEAQLLAAADCPNGQWTKSLQDETITRGSFTYTLTFAGFSCPYIDLSNAC